MFALPVTVPHEALQVTRESLAPRTLAVNACVSLGASVASLGETETRTPPRPHPATSAMSAKKAKSAGSRIIITNHQSRHPQAAMSKRRTLLAGPNKKGPLAR